MDFQMDINKKNLGDLFLSAQKAGTYQGYIEIDGIKIYRMVSINAKPGDKFKITIESTNSKYEQCVDLSIDGILSIKGDETKGKKVRLWANHFPKDGIIVEVLKNKKSYLNIYNAWAVDSKKDNVDFWVGNAAMIVENINNGKWRFHCNDSSGQGDFNNIVFTVVSVF